jgi:hypothetical protein
MSTGTNKPYREIHAPGLPFCGAVSFFTSFSFPFSRYLLQVDLINSIPPEFGRTSGLFFRSLIGPEGRGLQRRKLSAWSEDPEI